MYNALTNDWKGPKIKSLDPYHPECRAHLLTHFQKWLDEHPHTTVVRFTTFAFLFVIDTGEKIKISIVIGRVTVKPLARVLWKILNAALGINSPLKILWMQAITTERTRYHRSATVTG